MLNTGIFLGFLTVLDPSATDGGCCPAMCLDVSLKDRSGCAPISITSDTCWQSEWAQVAVH